MRVLIGQKPIDYCASKLIKTTQENFFYIASQHTREDKEFHNSSLVSYCIVWSVRT